MSGETTKCECGCPKHPCECSCQFGVAVDECAECAEIQRHQGADRVRTRHLPVRIPETVLRDRLEERRAIGWIKIPDREHWLVRVVTTNGYEIIGELFQVQDGHQYYALVYDRPFDTSSGCLESTSLIELEEYFNALSYGVS